MGKRSSFPRRKQDAYFTPKAAVVPLIPHLPAEGFTFVEPCAGDGRLIDHIEGLHSGADCLGAWDIDPQRNDIAQGDALLIKNFAADFIISNAPWTREILHPMIEHFSDLKPTWLLFDTDWLFTKQALPYLPRISKVVTIGRVSWMDNGKAGLENSAWYLFGNPCGEEFQFFGKGAPYAEVNA